MQALALDDLRSIARAWRSCIGQRCSPVWIRPVTGGCASGGGAGGHAPRDLTARDARSGLEPTTRSPRGTTAYLYTCWASWRSRCARWRSGCGAGRPSDAGGVAASPTGRARAWADGEAARLAARGPPPTARTGTRSLHGGDRQRPLRSGAGFASAGEHERFRGEPEGGEPSRRRRTVSGMTTLATVSLNASERRPRGVSFELIRGGVRPDSRLRKRPRLVWCRLIEPSRRVRGPRLPRRVGRPAYDESHGHRGGQTAPDRPRP